MVFSTLQFLFFFFPLVWAGYYFVKIEYANLWLLIASLLFYYIGDKDHMFLLVGVILTAYTAGILIQKSVSRCFRRFIMVSSVLVMLLFMSYYKYWNFMIENINALFGKNFAVENIVFPVGISFFVFQAVSYVVDVYKGEKALKNPIDMALYISFFPQLIAGPIVRFHNISEYLDKKYRKISVNNVENGIWRFCIGLSKKVLLANNLGGLADIVFSVKDISRFSVMYTWLGAIAYTLQIYFDFSGYSDMAIGLGEVFGFPFQENFNYPYIAKSVKDFWRRWHISLSQFFRDYVYIPLSGSRCSLKRWIFNILCVWVLTGLWHGASWNYVVWGVMYGLLLILERIIGENAEDNKIRQIVGHIYTVSAVILLWVVFRTADLSQAVHYLKNMFGIGAGSFVDHAFIFQARNYGLLVVIAMVCCLPVSDIIKRYLGESKLLDGIKLIALMICTILSVSFIYMNSYNPFLYFMF